MAKEKQIDPVDTLSIPKEYREEFIRIIKYGVHHSPLIDGTLYDILKEWISWEESKIDKFEGRETPEEEPPSEEVGYILAEPIEEGVEAP